MAKSKGTSYKRPLIPVGPIMRMTDPVTQRNRWFQSRFATPLAALFIACITLLIGCSRTPDEAEKLHDASGIPIYTYEVVQTFPHDTRAFTQGLQIHEGILYESTGRHGESSLRKVDLKTGRVLKRVNLPRRYFGEGIAIVGDQIFMLTWQEQAGFIFDRHTFERIGDFSYEGEGWGLAFDGTHLIMSDGTPILRFLDVDTQEVVRTQEIRAGELPLRNINELAWIEGELWANIFTTDFIARIDIEQGKVTGWIDGTGILPREAITSRVDVMNGIAYNVEEGRIFVTGKLWPLLFEIRVVPKLAAVQSPVTELVCAG